MISDLNIRLQVATVALLRDITAPRGVLAMLANGLVYEQTTSPTGNNWQAVEQGFRAYAGSGYGRWEDARSYEKV